MKKLINIILTIVISLFMFCLISACNKETKDDMSTTKSSSITEQITVLTTRNLETINNENDVGGGIITVQKYRHKFYSVPGPFIDYVDRDEYYEWLLTIDHTSTAEVMVIKQFIQHFGITREQFDKANLECAKRIQDKLNGTPCISPKDYANQEDDEIYNADIIFTFDDDLIRKYYLSPDYPFLYDIEFEEAVERGEYISQTEKWIDIEQMESEIIAKYGEFEIVTETTLPDKSTTTAISDEITTTEQATTETTE